MEKRTIRRVALRLIPIMFILYIVAYLDRINVGFAALQMNAELDLSHASFGLGSGIFFIGYFIFEIPSNLILHRVGARLWIARIMITWGIVAVAMMFIQGPKSFYALRFLLGLAEAGFFPGMILYLTYWFPGRYMARNVALFMTAMPLAGIIGGPVSGAIMEMHGLGGVSGWQWLFLLEGLPAIFLGVMVFFYLPERPEKATWIPKEEKEWLLDQLNEERDKKEGKRNFLQAIKSGKVWILSLAYFSIIVAMYGISIWMPSILKSVSNLSNFMIGVVSILPYLATAFFMLVVGLSSDRTGERRLHMVESMVLASVGFFLSALAGSLSVEVACIAITAMGIWGALGPFWALTSSFLSGTGAAGGIALINSIGNLGGFVGPSLVGFFLDWTGTYNAGFAMLGCIIFLGGILVWHLKFVGGQRD